MKKLILMLMVVVLMFSLVSVAWADEGIDETSLAKIEDLVEKANLKISKLVEKAIVDADKRIDDYEEKVSKIEEKQNNDEKLIKLTESLDHDLNRIIDNVVDHTNKIAAKTFEAGEKEGIVIECSIIEVVIGDRTVLIDPLRIRGY